MEISQGLAVSAGIYPNQKVALELGTATVCMARLPRHECQLRLFIWLPVLGLDFK